MSADRILTRLEGVRDLCGGRWSARCPAHEDRRASLSIREVDGRTLLHCFAGCGIDDVLGAIGLTLADLFDRPAAHHSRPERRPFDAVQVLYAVAHEAAVVALMADTMAAGDALTVTAQRRLATASDRIHRALDLIGDSVPEAIKTIRRGAA